MTGNSSLRLRHFLVLIILLAFSTFAFTGCKEHPDSGSSSVADTSTSVYQDSGNSQQNGVKDNQSLPASSAVIASSDGKGGNAADGSSSVSTASNPVSQSASSAEVSSGSNAAIAVSSESGTNNAFKN